MSWYCNKSINWGDNSKFITNFENKRACWDKISQNLRSFPAKYLWRSYVLAKALSLRFTVIFLMILKLAIWWYFTQASSEPSRTSKMERLAKIANSWKRKALFLRNSPSIGFWISLCFIMVLWTLTCDPGLFLI